MAGVEITFDKTIHDFGRVKKGEQVSTVFKFTNTGTEDVVLELVSGCDCSKLEYEEMGVYKPGEVAEIKVTYLTADEEKKAQEKTLDIILENENPKTGYQYIFDVKYKAIVY